jgi:hypothetical protein
MSLAERGDMREGMGLIFALEEPSGYEYVERKRELVIITTQTRTLVVRSVSQVGWGSDGDRDPHALECHDATASLMREWVDRLTRHDETIDPQDQPMTDAARVIAPTV